MCGKMWSCKSRPCETFEGALEAPDTFLDTIIPASCFHLVNTAASQFPDIQQLLFCFNSTGNMCGKGDTISLL